jgi:hypothetical protein
MRVTAAALVAGLVVTLGAGCGSGRPPLPAGALRDLASADAFRAIFNAGVGTPRLVLLLSPT